MSKVTGYTNQFPFCCGADITGEFYPGDIDTVTKAREVHEVAMDGMEAGLSVITLTNLRPEVFEEFHRLGWHDLITWKSNHGNYPITMLGYLDPKYEYVEPNAPSNS